MWIMLTVKLPTKPSPPKLSMFWSTPNHKDYTLKLKGDLQKNRKKKSYDYIFNEDSYLEAMDSELDDYREGRWINFAGANILVLRHEYSIISPENLKMYIQESHELVLADVAGEQLKKNIEINVDNRDIYGAALIDGCTEQEAMLVLMGVDLTIPDPDVPPIGWYRCHPQYAEIYCDDWEMVEDTENEKEFMERTS